MHRQKLMILALATLLPLNVSLAEEKLVQIFGLADPTLNESAPDASVAVPTSSLEELQAKLRERDRQYADLRKRAKALGVELPDTPPWRGAEARRRPQSDLDRYGAHHRQMMPMERREWDESHQADNHEMQERMEEEMSGIPAWERRRSRQEGEWARYRAIIEGMSDEERAACHAMQRRYMSGMGAMHGHPMRPAPGMMGPGYGYGPSPYAPPGNFWDPDR